MTVAKVEVVGLKQFRADLKRAGSEGPRALAKAIKAGGEPVLEATKVKAQRASRTGHLAGSYGIKVRTTTGSITSKADYAAGADWGKRGRWRGFFRYGQPPRFAGAALTENAERVQDIITKGLDDIVTVYGWAK
jgi:hypothetical protein